MGGHCLDIMYILDVTGRLQRILNRRESKRTERDKQREREIHVLREKEKKRGLISLYMLNRDTRDTCLYSEWCVVGGYDESMVVLILSSACNGPGLSACTAQKQLPDTTKTIKANTGGGGGSRGHTAELPTCCLSVQGKFWVGEGGGEAQNRLRSFRTLTKWCRHSAILKGLVSQNYLNTKAVL